MKNKQILATGGRGFLGTHVLNILKAQGYQNVVAPSSKEYDLTKQIDVERMFFDYDPEIVIHLAANVGGIGANQKSPGAFLYDNATMGLNIIEAARKSGVEKCIQVGTVCSYPKFTTVPFKEDDLWLGYPEETNAPYGIAKKLLLVQAQAYREQYGLNTVYIIPTNLYGPYDHFNLDTSHVIPALIYKIDQAMKNNTPLMVWGTGNASREFLYAEDCAEGIIKAMESYNSHLPVNLGTGIEVKIEILVQMITQKMGFDGAVIFDASKPDGQPRRCLNVERAKQFGFVAKTFLESGLDLTIKWYRENKGTIYMTTPRGK